MRQLLIALAALAVVAVIQAAYYVYRWSADRRRDELRRRLHALRDSGEGPAVSLLRPGKYAATPGLDAFLRSIPVASWLEGLLVQADSRFTVAQMLGFCTLSAAAGLLAGTWAGGGAALQVLGVGCGAAAPVLLLVAARDRRSGKLSEQLPEALEMMARSLRAGHALSSSFELVAGEMPEPIAVEFGRAFEAQRLGIPVEQAIVQMTERAPGNRDLKIFAVSAVIQKETGGNLAEILSNLADTIRSRYRFYGKLRALTAEGRASAVLVGAMPFVVALIMRAVNPGYLAVLTTTPTGRTILAGAVASWVVGIVWLYRMTRLEA